MAQRRRADPKMGPRRKQEDKHLKILRELVTQPQNKKCFDCGQRGPTYVNMTIGAFVCTSCSGHLRGLNPPHRIKSISMASFNAQEIEFLQAHGNEVCRSTWLALWESPSAAEPESREEQKVKDFLGKKYERKVWYSSKPKPEASEPEAKPLKALLGEHSPPIVIGSKQEQKSASIKPPHGITVQPPKEPVQPKQESKSNMDLLGDLGGDFFAPAPATSQGGSDAFGMFAQPPPAQNQQAPLFDAFAPTPAQPQQPAASNSLDFFSSSSSSGSTQPTSNTDFFSMSSASSSQAPTSSAFPPPANTGGDKYAALADIGGGSVFNSQPAIFGSNSNSAAGGQSSIFTSNTTNNSTNTNIFGSQDQQQPAPPTQQPNPFMMSSNPPRQPQQPQQQQKPLNPFQMGTSSSGTMSQAGQLDNFGNTMNTASNGNWAGQPSNAQQQQFSNNMNSTNIFNTQPVAASNFNMQSSMQQQPQSVFSNNMNYNVAPAQPQQINFAANNFSQQQQPSNNIFASQNFNATSNNAFGQPPPQAQPQQQNFGNFGAQQPATAAQQKPFGGIQMPGFGQFPQQQQQQQQQSFGTWGQQPSQQQHRQPVKSNNPFM